MIAMPMIITAMTAAILQLRASWKITRAAVAVRIIPTHDYTPWASAVGMPSSSTTDSR